MEVIATFEPNLKTEHNLEKLPGEVMYAIAKQTLDMTIPSIPMSIGLPTSGALRRTSMSAGVLSDGYNEYHIGSFTEYASHVWNLNDTTTNWTTTDTHSQWYARTLKQHGKLIIDNAVNRTWKENM